MGTILQEIPEDSAEDEVKTPVNTPVNTPYEKLLHAVHDPKFTHEVALEKRVGLYKFCGDIGRGNFSRVKKAVHLLTKDKVAVKIVDRSRLDTRNLRMLSREVSTLEKVQHPHILRLFEVVETLGRVHLVTEYVCGGELYYRIVQNGVFTEQKATRIFKQLGLAIQHMHNLGFVHRDVKAENVLVISDDHVKLADFGFSTQIINSQHLNTFCGSPPYASPELFSDDHYQGMPVDIWALGILLYFVLIGNMPFFGPTVPQLRSAILKGEYRIPAHFSASCIKLMQCILLHNPLHRPKIDQILRCEWLIKPKKISNGSELSAARTIISKRKKANFWCTRSNSTRSNPSIHLHRQTEPIDCYTKKYNNVPIEKFINPIDDAKSLSGSSAIPNHTTIIPITNLSTFNNRNVRNGNNNDSNGPIEIIQHNDIIQVRSYSQDQNNGLDELSFNDGSVESENKDFDRFMMLPSKTNNDENLLRALHPFEAQTREIMRTYGITDEMLEKNIQHGPRSELIGIYRIIITRLKTHKIAQTAPTTINNESPVHLKLNDKINNNNNNHQKTLHKKQKTKLCAIL